MNLAPIRARMEEPFFRMRMRDHYEFHKRRFYNEFNAGRWPDRHHSRAHFFLGMALDGEWDAIEQWQPPLNTPEYSDSTATP